MKPLTLEQLNYLVEICEHGEHRIDCPVCHQEIWRRAEVKSSSRMKLEVLLHEERHPLVRVQGS